MTALYRLCIDCERPISAARPVSAGVSRYGAYGRCQACDKRMARTDAAPTVQARKQTRAAETDAWPRRP